MSMNIVSGSYQTLWVPVSDGETVYVGGIVAVDHSAPTEGVEMLDVADGVANKANNDIPFGVVIGTNRKNPLYSSTHLCEYIIAPDLTTDPHDGASIEYTWALKARGRKVIRFRWLRLTLLRLCR